MSTVKFTNVEYGIVALTLATAFIHLIFAFTLVTTWGNVKITFINLDTGLSYQIFFVISFLGYVILLIPSFLPQFENYKGTARFALLAYTAITLLLYILINTNLDIMNIENLFFLEGTVTKVIEFFLFIFLVIDSQMTSK